MATKKTRPLESGDPVYPFQPLTAERPISGKILPRKIEVISISNRVILEGMENRLA